MPVIVQPGGAASLSFTWPAGLLSGQAVAFQFWIADAGAPHGFAASNGLLGVNE